LLEPAYDHGAAERRSEGHERRSSREAERSTRLVEVDDLDDLRAYVRIQDPRLWLEIAAQDAILLSGVHYHLILRDITSDYGA
jgi:hypothetical protein